MRKKMSNGFLFKISYIANINVWHKIILVLYL